MKPLIIVLMVSLFLAAFLLLADDAKPGWQTEGERNLFAAEKEGEVTVAIDDQGPVTVGVVDAFQTTFEKLRVNSPRARGCQIGPKIIGERIKGVGSFHSLFGRLREFIGDSRPSLLPVATLPGFDELIIVVKLA